MVELLEALAIERAKRQQDAFEASTKEEVGRVVLGAFAERLNESPVPNWLFLLERDHIKIIFGAPGSQSEIATWKLDDRMCLVMRDEATEWITAESFARVIDQAVQLTAKMIVDVEASGGRTSAGIVDLHPRF